jgi:hypothetical protein
MDMHVPQTWNQELTARIYDLRVLRDFHLASLADICDAVADDNDGHIGLRLGTGHINQIYV